MLFLKPFFLPVLAMLLLFTACSDGAAKLVIYPAPQGEELSPDFSLKVDGQDAFVYRARVSAYPINQVWPGYQRPVEQTEMASFSYFDCSGKLRVELTSAKEFEEVIIRPLSLGIVPEVEGNTIRFELSGPSQLVVELDGYHHAFHLFANPLETDRPDPDDPSVHYFGPGMHEIGILKLKSNEQVYIAGGAVVHGVITARDATGIRISGRGILDASNVKRFEAPQMVSAYGCEQMEVEGLILRDPHAWTIITVNCRDVRLSNLKLLGHWRYKADGIDIVNSQEVLIEDCFVRAFDDNIALKGMKMRGNISGENNLRDIEVRGCVLWHDWGRALEIGAETVADSIHDILFTDCDIIHYVHYAMDIQNGDRATVTNVRYEDIRVEEPIMDSARIAERAYDPALLGHLIDLNIRANPYSKDSLRGRINHIHFKDISFTGGYFPHTSLTGFSKENMVEDITFQNIILNGKPARNEEDLGLSKNEFTGQLSIK